MELWDIYDSDRQPSGYTHIRGSEGENPSELDNGEFVPMFDSIDIVLNIENHCVQNVRSVQYMWRLQPYEYIDEILGCKKKLESGYQYSNQK